MEGKVIMKKSIMQVLEDNKKTISSYAKTCAHLRDIKLTVRPKNAPIIEGQGRLELGDSDISDVAIYTRILSPEVPNEIAEYLRAELENAFDKVANEMELRCELFINEQLSKTE
jgi:hypothetical protein